MRPARQRQSDAVLVASSTRNPLPSQSPSGHAPGSCEPARLMRSAFTGALSLARRSSAKRRISRRVAVLTRVVHELRVLLLEGERDRADRSVSVLGDDQVGLAHALGVLVVVLVAVDEHDEVGVLLEVAALAQV